MEYKLVRSDRKTMGIYITKSATVEVRIPKMATLAQVEKFVAKNQKWIDTKLAAATERGQNRAEFAIKIGDSARLMGEEYPICGVDEWSAGFDGKRFFLPRSYEAEAVKQTMEVLYKRIALDVLTQKTQAFAVAMGVSVAKVKVNSARTRWGSCSAKASINYSWRLIMADQGVIDYVVVHELAHLKQLNHSSAFWSEVSSVMPDYKEREARLNDLQKKLMNEDW